ncbi:MAG TPA: DUF1704 domain-containing protein [Candidatus Luteococcus avicola]|nr:DUF1704 domain-containing protein [Candidatus Luteococcus avicola]
MRAFSQNDRRVDAELAALGDSLRFLLDVTPMNASEVRARWVAGDHCEPDFAYRELSTDPDVLKAGLARIDVNTVDDPTLRSLLAAKHRELTQQAEMMLARNTSDFLPLAIEHYGAVTPGLRDIARQVMDEVPLPEASGDPVSAEDFLVLAQAEIDWYHQQDPDVVMHAEIREDVSGVMVSHDTLLVPSGIPCTADRANALLQHEVGTHLVTQVNGSAQQITCLGGGLAGCDETQEGLAVLGEVASGQFTRARLRQLAGRVLVVDAMTHGTPFDECWQQLVSRGTKRGSAFTTVMRVFRGGGLTKDACYLRGLVDLLSHIEHGGRLDLMFRGKFALRDLGLVEQLERDGRLAPPRLEAHWLAMPDAPERLARAATTPLAQLVA